MTSAEVIERLRGREFAIVSIRGSHHKLRNNAGTVVIVPHPKKDLGKGLVAAIQAGRHRAGKQENLRCCFRLPSRSATPSMRTE